MISKKLVWRCAGKIEYENFTLSDLIDKLSEEVSRQDLKDKKRFYDVNDIVKVVCRTLNLDEKDVKSRSRKRELVHARQISMYLIYKYTQLGLAKTADVFNRDHATAIHAIRSIKDAKHGFDAVFKRIFDACEKQLMLEKVSYTKELDIDKR